MKLYVGANVFKPEGWTTVDIIPDYQPDLVEDTCVLPSVQDETVDEVYAGHVLEHVGDPWQALLTWRRVLKPGGVLTVVVPDHQYSVRRWANNEPFEGMLVVDGAPAPVGSLLGFLGVTAGHIGYASYFAAHSLNHNAAQAQLHLRSFDKPTLWGMLEACGFEDLQEVTYHPCMSCQVDWQFGITGRKME